MLQSCVQFFTAFCGFSFRWPLRWRFPYDRWHLGRFLAVLAQCKLRTVRKTVSGIESYTFSPSKGCGVTRRCYGYFGCVLKHDAPDLLHGRYDSKEACEKVPESVRDQS